MDPKTHRIDPGTPSESDRLIERGHWALAAITSEAHAARVAAQKAELEVALAEARSGDANMLRSWLENYRGMSDSPNVELVQTSTREKSVATSQFILPVPDAETPVAGPVVAELSWDQLLPAARQRLQERSSQLELSETDVAVVSNSLAPWTEKQIANEDREELVNVPHNDSRTTSAIDIEIESDFESEHSHADEEFPSDEFSESDSLVESHEPEESQPLVYQELPELQALSEVERDLSKPFFRSGKRGFAFSVFVHSVLIGTLMAITMRAPEEVASMGFEAGTSESTADSFEELQPMEVTSTEEISVEMPSETSESSVSLPSAVGLASTSVNAASATAASSMSGVQASANHAVAASSGRPNPAHANASFFGAGASGNCFCYVIDGSESMRGGPWEAAKAELLRSLSSMKESHRFYIVFFNQKLSAITMPGEREPATTPLYATAENLRHAQNWIESLRIERGAPPNDALLHAIEIEPDAIYLLADGATKIDVPGFLREKNRTSDFISGEQVRVPIHAIAFYSPDSGQKLMKQVAAENKGQYIYVPDPRKK